jgi:hypothetical protein
VPNQTPNKIDEAEGKVGGDIEILNDGTSPP